jgi:hypothetical protein
MFQSSGSLHFQKGKTNYLSAIAKVSKGTGWIY